MTEAKQWSLPQDLARTLVAQGEDIALLFSSLRTGYSGRYSYLAWGRERSVTGEQMDVLRQCTTHMRPLPHWFGYIGYEADGGLTQRGATRPATLRQPPIRFDYFAHVVRFDHHTRRYQLDGITALPDVDCASPQEMPSVQEPHAHMSHGAYVAHVEDALANIHAGQFYQVNLTRKCEGTFTQPLTSRQAFALFERLGAVSPAPYSAFLSHDGHYILSSSPELFMSVQGRHIQTRPIKGTAPRNVDAQQLYHSEKDRAENLMIVDLMRHDIAQCTEAGSVRVPQLFDVDSFSTLHHLSSTVEGQLREGTTLEEVLRSTFPPGSMTGAPKIAAMEWIAQHEGRQRGVYSGALGWINGQDCELSVVIRTLIAQGRHYEFQVGGGIVADSDAQAEYRETQTKAQGVCRAMGVSDVL